MEDSRIKRGRMESEIDSILNTIDVINGKISDLIAKLETP